MENELKLIEANKKLSKINQLLRLLNIPFDAVNGDFSRFDEFIDINDKTLFEIGKNSFWVLPNSSDLT